MFKKLLFILSFSMTTFCFSQQRDFIFGQLVDSTQNEPIPFASIRVKDKALGVISNVDGTFKIPLRFKTLGERIEISCLGYTSKEIHIEDLAEGKSNVIILKPGSFELTEAVVSANIKKFSAKQIVKIAINSIPQNYPQSKFGLVGYYRDYQVKNGNYTNLNEAIIKVIDEGFGKKNSYYNQYQLLSHEINLDFEIDSFAKQPYDYNGYNKIVPGAKMKNDGGNEFIILAMHDVLRNYSEESFSFIYDIRKDFLDSHRFKLRGKTNYRKQRVYEIEGTYRDDDYVAKAKIFINTDDFAILKLDYAVYKRKKPLEKSLAVNPEERYSDGFKAMNNEIIYHIQTEYTHNPQGIMFLNYISFYNKILVQRPAAFKSRLSISLGDNSFLVRLNKLPNEPNKIKNKDFNITYQDQTVPIKEFYFLEDERTFVVCPNLKESKSEVLFNQLFIKKENLQVADVKYNFENISDNLGNKLDERKWEYLHQYREFFTQEVTPKSEEEIEKDKRMLNAIPLENDLQPIYAGEMKNEYWLNTPLPTLQK